jgi:hypothetical protein
MLVANGFKTAAYCELLFEPQCPHDKPCDGGAQVRRCLTNITSGKMYPVQQGDLAFIALDVEDKNDLGNTDAAVKLIMDAVNAIPAPLRPVIYTDRGQWNSITGSSTAFSSNLLWLAGNMPTLTLTPSFDGWTTSTLLGKLYEQNVSLAGISPVDFDVFDPSLFQ